MKKAVSGKKKISADTSTEEKIKVAARTVFTKKGYAAARTRDIAEEAGLNLALLNYYFRSKEKLFDIVMLENLQVFIKGLHQVFYDENSSLQEKIIAISSNYIDMLKLNPDLPLFILSEIRTHPQKFAQTVGFDQVIPGSPFFRQITEISGSRIHPVQILLNILGLTIFPFIANPLLKAVTGIKQEQFDQLMEERKKLIPLWIDSILKT